MAREIMESISRAFPGASFEFSGSGDDGRKQPSPPPTAFSSCTPVYYHCSTFLGFDITQAKPIFACSCPSSQRNYCGCSLLQESGGKMRPWTFLAPCLLVGAALALALTCLRSSGTSILDSASGNHEFIMTDDKGIIPGLVVITNRKLKESKYGIDNPKFTWDLEETDVEDYPRFNPVPSKATIKAGPIEHGTPLMPYIPKPTPPAKPPTHPKHGSP